MLKTALAVLAVLSGCTTTLLSQTYPSRQITIVVPFAAGGPADALSRLLGERMRKPLGQTLVIENVPGAAGVQGVQRVAQADPDGHTIGIGHLGTHVMNGALYKLKFDLLTDLAPIALLPSYTYAIASKPQVPAKDLKELLVWLKANPDQATVATAGHGSVGHIASIFFGKMTGVNLRVVPYRGGGQALSDVAAGHTTILFDQVTDASIALYRGGKTKPIAVMASARLAAASDIPTVDEAGLAGLHVSTWYGLWAPKGTPPEIVGKLNAAVVEALADPEIIKRFASQAAQIPPPERQTPAALAAHHKAEIEKWHPIIRDANIKLD
jgi:tripartite-type tricarboxylate transporter receptor subunit TctC